jgi:hypothetical protein
MILTDFYDYELWKDKGRKHDRLKVFPGDLRIGTPFYPRNCNGIIAWGTYRIKVQLKFLNKFAVEGQIADI